MVMLGVVWVWVGGGLWMLEEDSDVGWASCVSVVSTLSLVRSTASQSISFRVTRISGSSATLLSLYLASRCCSLSSLLFSGLQNVRLGEQWIFDRGAQALYSGSTRGVE